MPAWQTERHRANCADFGMHHMQDRIRVLWVYVLFASLTACGSGKDTSRIAKVGAGGAPAGGAAAGGLAGVGAQATAGGAASVPPLKAIEYDGLNGFARNPIIGHVFTADPSAHVFEGRIYVYASHDVDGQTGYNMKDYHVFSSNDLVNWQDHGVALDVANIKWARILYAPDCAYSKVTGKYYLYFPNGGTNIGVAVSDSPGGPFVDALGGPLVDIHTPGVEDVDWIFDPACFVDDDGQAYLYFGGGMPDTGDNARVIRLGADMVSLADASATVISAPDFFEASFMHRRGGKYYFSYSTTTATHAATIDYMMSDNPMTGFSYVGTVLPNPTLNYNQNNHHSIVEYEGSSYIFYHNREIVRRDKLSSTYTRSITLDHLAYAADGTMVPASRTTGKVAQLRNLDAFSRLEAETMGDQRGIEVDFADDAGVRVGVAVTQIHDEDWIGYSQVDFADGATSFRARVAAGSAAGGTINVYVDGSDMFTNLQGVRLGACLVSPTGSWQTWTDIECPTEPTTGVHDVYLRFSGIGTEPLFNIDFFQFE
jgi:arabinoxylan arabinofuranohydrolase